MRGVLAQREEGSPEVTTFFRKELRLAPTLVRWQRRTLRYLRNRRGHRFCEEGTVCETRQSDFAGSGERRGAELVSPTCNVTEVMTLALHHPVASESRHRQRLVGMNTAPASQAVTSVGARRPATSLSLFPDLSTAATASPAEIAAIILVQAGGYYKDPRTPLVRTSC